MKFTGAISLRVRYTTLAHTLQFALFLFLNTIWLTNKNSLDSFRCAANRRRNLFFRSHEMKLS